jgi:hypothetical protein
LVFRVGLRVCRAVNRSSVPALAPADRPPRWSRPGAPIQLTIVENSRQLIDHRAGRGAVAFLVGTARGHSNLRWPTAFPQFLRDGQCKQRLT